MKISQKFKEVRAIVCLRQTHDGSSLAIKPSSTKTYKVKLVLQKTSKNDSSQNSPLKKSKSILSHMMKSEYDAFIMSSCKFNQINKSVVQDFVNSMRMELKTHDVYDRLLESQYIIDILDQYQKCYINHQQFIQLVQIVLDYMALSKNYLSKDTQKLLTNLKVNNLSSSIAQRWLRLKNQIYFNNKDSLKILQYIFPSSLYKSQLEHSFCQLQFDFSLKEVRQVASTVKSLCKYDMRAFCFLTNYLYISCIKLEEAGNKLSDIDSTLRSILQLLDEQNLPAPPFDGEASAVEIHRDFKLKNHEYPHKYIDLNQLQGKHKVQALQNYVQRRINEAIHVFNAFNDMVKNICLKYGYHFLSSLKLKDKAEKMALNRVLEKIVLDYAVNTMQQSRQRAHRCMSIEDLVNSQYQKYQNHIKDIINHIKDPIQFKVSDLIRSKCMFATVQKLNHCLTQLKEEIQKRGYKIIELKNRLQKKTSDILIKLLIDSSTAEIQLALDFKVAENEFNHKIYELRRSQLFSPLTMLKQLNQRISTNFFKELNLMINSNVRVTSTHEYFEDISFDDAQEHFRELIQKLPLKIDFNKPHRNQIDINLMTKQVKRFAGIVSQKLNQTPVLNKIEKLKRNGEYIYQMKVYEQAENWLEKYCQSFKYEYQSIFNKVNYSFSALTATWNGNHGHLASSGGLFEEAEKYLIRNYAGALHLISKINMDIGNYDKSIHTCEVCKNLLIKIEIDEKDEFLGQLEKDIGWNSFKKGNYSEAIQNYESYLNTIQELKGRNNMDYALILNNIGLVLEKAGNYNESLRYFQKSLNIEESIKGKYCTEYAATLENIGIAYLNQGYYAKCIQIFQTCLEIEEKLMGKDSINCAQTLNNLGNVCHKMGKSEQALVYYKRCLLIEEKVKGKQYIDYAMILNNIGIIYLSECNYEQALAFYKRCLSIKEKTMGKSNIDLIPTLTNIGLANAWMGNYPDALRYYKRCMSIHEQTNNKDNIDYSNTLNNLAIVEKEIGNFRQAIEHLERAMTIIEGTQGKDCIDYAFLLSSLGQVYFDQQAYDYSLVHYEIALEKTAVIVGRESLECANLINCIGQIRCKMEEYQEAIKCSEQSLSILQKIKGKNKIDNVPCLNNMAESYLKMEKPNEAERLYRQSIKICESLKVKFIQYARACLGLAQVLKVIGQDAIEQAFLREEGLRLYAKLKPQLFKSLSKQMQNL